MSQQALADVVQWLLYATIACWTGYFIAVLGDYIYRQWAKDRERRRRGLGTGR